MAEMMDGLSLITDDDARKKVCLAATAVMCQKQSCVAQPLVRKSAQAKKLSMIQQKAMMLHIRAEADISHSTYALLVV